MSNAVKYQRRPAGAKRPRLVSASRFPLSIPGLFFAAMMTAVVARWPLMLGAALLAIPYIANAAWEPRTRGCAFATYGLVLASFYAPVIKGFFSDSSHCRDVWATMFPVAPGLMPVHFCSTFAGGAQPVEDGAVGAAASVICVTLMALYAGGLTSRVGLATSMILGFIGSAISSFVFEALLHA